MKLQARNFPCLLGLVAAVINILLVSVPASYGSADCGPLSSDCTCSAVCCLKVEENSPKGTHIGVLQETLAIDSIVVNNNYLNTNLSLHFKLNSVQCSNNLFSEHLGISNHSTGAIVTNKMLDNELYRDTCGLACLQVIAVVSFAEDTEVSPSQFIVLLDVVDVNDNEPQFQHTLNTNSTLFTMSVPETHLTNQTLFCSDALIAVDKDISTVIVYSVLLPFSANFSVYTDGNELCVQNLTPLDRELNDNISFVIEAQDVSISRNLTSNITVVLLLTDENDNSPVFINPLLEVNVFENITIGNEIVQYLATDDDIGSNGDIVYSLEPDSTPFIINSTSGALYVGQGLDVDTVSTNSKTYVFTVIATDGGGKSGQESVTIHVLNANDNPPVISVTSTLKTVPEGPIANQSHLFLIAVEDKDKDLMNGKVTVGNEYIQIHLLSIIGNKHVFSLRTKVDEFDYEQVKTILINITITDEGSPALMSFELFTISVTDVNDNAPYLTQTEFNVTELDENAMGLTLFKLRDYFADLDSGLNENNKSGGFELLSGNGDVKLQEADGAVSAETILDREKIDNLSFDVLIFDEGTPQLNSTVTIVLNLLDINDNSPMFNEVQDGELEINENEGPTVIGTLTAVDSDLGLNGTVRYYLNSSLFLIDNVTGELRSVSEFDREEQNSYNLTVLAEDQGTPQRSTTITVTVYVKDVNDNAPEFNTNVTQTLFTINATAEMDTVLGQMVAYDIDEGSNAIIFYQLDESNTFDIDNNGYIRTIRDLEMNDVGERNLVVTAFNENDRELNSTTDIYICVLPINDTMAGENNFETILLYGAISGGVFILVIAILILLCCICCVCYHHHYSQSKTLSPLLPPKSVSVKRILMTRVSTSSSTKGDDPAINGDVPRSPTIIFSDECEVKYFTQDQPSGKTETIQVEENKYEETAFGNSVIESPQIPTKDIQPEMEEVFSPPLSEDLSSNSSLSNSVYQSTAANPYYEHSPKNHHSPLCEDTLKKHNEAISSKNYPPQHVYSLEPCCPP